MTSAAQILAEWATGLTPTNEDRTLAERALKDTLAVMYAAREHPLRHLFDQLPAAGRYAALAHVLDFDDLHMPSTTHISAVCVPVALASASTSGRDDGTDPQRAYLAGAGVMARLGQALGWRHYTSGWHATCTAGAPAAAVTAAIARGLGPEQTATAIALALPAAGGVQRAFGTSAKALQVGFAAEAGIRAATLAQAGATADLAALDEWIALVGGDPKNLQHKQDPDAVPGGLAVKPYPCCYALQRPISAVVDLGPVRADTIQSINVTTPASSLKPLIHRRPSTGLEGKFSLEYAIAATLLDGRPDLQSFTDEAVRRPEAQRLGTRVRVTPTENGNGLLDGDISVEITLDSQPIARTKLTLPPGAPGRPPTDQELQQKLEACAGVKAHDLATVTWETAPGLIEDLMR